ncbi:MAG: SLBB domain-containing protein [Candidatus Cloacimonetes bacterium]|nr:SLBB domain-containing protein [Candidatus Cloacimonadota bacterium]
MNTFKKINIILIVIVIFSINLSAQFKYKTEETLYSVSVVGAVDNPGVFLVPSSSRISEVIKIANVIPDSLLPEEFVNYSNRNITLRRNGIDTRIDLKRFFVLGDEKNNPYLLDGDFVIVPAIQKRVLVEGAVNRPGLYELIDGDRVFDIIDLAMGLQESAYLEKAEVIRYTTNNKKTENFSISLQNIINNSDCEDNIFLQNDDRIIIRFIPEFHEEKFIIICGEVQFPGYYSIEENETTLLEILEKCGGPTSHADLQNAFLQRRSREDVLDTEFERLKKMLVEDMTMLEYEYFKTKSRELRGKFAINFENIWNSKDKSLDIFLKNDDCIFFPDESITVTVSGQVKNPGLIKFVPGKNYLYYIEQAGGFSWNARKRKIRLIKAGTGEWLKPKKDTIVEVKDMIFVPEKPEYNYWKLTKDIVFMLSQVTTLYIIVDNIITTK